MTGFKTLFAIACVATFGLRAADAAEGLLLKPGDHIAIVGNGLADRLQHDGWLETLLQAEFSDRHLVIRNLGFAGDELTAQMRCDNFGSADDWLARTRADVVLAFFGYNESFGGPKGVIKFKQDLANYIRNLGQHKYNSNSPPQLVLLSPIGHENVHNPNLPDGTSNNVNLKLYTGAMAEVAKQNGVLFVDLYTPSRELYAKSSAPLTIDGVHLSEGGNYALAPVILRSLFPEQKLPHKDGAELEQLRAAI